MKKFGRYSRLAIVLTVAFCLLVPVSVMAKVVRKVDNLLVLIDASGSMSQELGDLNQKKIDAAVDLVSSFDEAVPELGYTTGVYTVAPFEEISPLQTYNNGAISSAAGDVDTDFGLTGRLSNLGGGLKNTGKTIETGETVGEEKMPLPGKTAIVLFTDGEANTGTDPAVAAQALYDMFPNVCVHTVSLADTEKGQEIIDSINRVSDCSASADYKSLSTKAGMAAFAEQVLYEEVPDEVVVVTEKEVLTFNLLFGFDKAEITDDMIPVLEQVQMILEEDPAAQFIVAGHTDSVGTEVYNQGLSERRAGAVSNWLVENGVDAYRLEVVGYGEMVPKYDNNTEEGRTLNRRVEIITK